MAQIDGFEQPLPTISFGPGDPRDVKELDAAELADLATSLETFPSVAWSM